MGSMCPIVLKGLTPVESICCSIYSFTLNTILMKARQNPFSKYWLLHRLVKGNTQQQATLPVRKCSSQLANMQDQSIYSRSVQQSVCCPSCLTHNSIRLHVRLLARFSICGSISWNTHVTDSFSSSVVPSRFLLDKGL